MYISYHCLFIFLNSLSCLQNSTALVVIHLNFFIIPSIFNHPDNSIWDILVTQMFRSCQFMNHWHHNSSHICILYQFWAIQFFLVFFFTCYDDLLISQLFLVMHQCYLICSLKGPYMCAGNPHSHYLVSSILCSW